LGGILPDKITNSYIIVEGGTISMDKVFKQVVKKPIECSSEELELAKKLVLAGKQVAADGLDERLMKCKALGFFYADNELVGVSAIKEKREESVKRTQKKAKIKGKEIPTLELGYSYTKPEFRGQGINKKLNDELLELVANKKIYATTDNDTLRKYLATKGFKKIGESFKGNFNENLDYFER
jgi:ribosomal protein S18 acetylase RimI-like enzyme